MPPGGPLFTGPDRTGGYSPATMIADATTRISKLATELNDSGADCFIAWHPVSMSYLHGFGEGSHERFMALSVRANGDVALICPALSATQAGRAGIQDIRPWKDGEDPIELFQGLANEWDLRSAIL